jgi:hypothetical protein
MSISRVVGTLAGFVSPKRSTRFVQCSEKRDLSPARDTHTVVSRFQKRKDSRPGHFFGFAFFTANFLSPFFALLPRSRTL